MNRETKNNIPTVKEQQELFETLAQRYSNVQLKKDRFEWIAQFFLWFGFVFPGFLMNFNDGQFRMLAWLSIAAIMLNFGGKFYFGSRVFNLHEFLLPLTKEEYREEYCKDSIVVLSGMMSKYKNQQNMLIRGAHSLYLLGTILACGNFGYLIYGVGFNGFSGTSLIVLLNWMQISAILVGLFLFFRNVWLIIVLVFVNMKILHHITFWIYKADLSSPDSEEHVPHRKNGRIHDYGKSLCRDYRFRLRVVFNADHDVLFGDCL